ncbi:hypothetical protein OZX68_01265 [Streptococcaceae bacterium ESL0729]|nr:hypothetical protein OZX68_01265 [Streptococcaceae bacterium ESL0729]
MSLFKWVDLALKYGGYMEMDKPLLANRLNLLASDQEKLALVTPPASVVNAYFSELYQKKSPQDALDYFLDLSRALNNFNAEPDFRQEGDENYPSYRFIRLNLQKLSYGFVFTNDRGDALVFPEDRTKKPEDAIFLQLANLFPGYGVFWKPEESAIKVQPMDEFSEEVINEKILNDFPNSKIFYHKSYVLVESMKFDELTGLSQLLGAGCDKILLLDRDTNGDDKLKVFLKP